MEDFVTTEISSFERNETLSDLIFNAALSFDKFYTPILCLFGFVGNTFSILIFSKDSKYRNQSALYYLSALAISDIGFLLNLFLLWLESLYEGGILTSDILCPLIMYLGQVTCFVSVYLIVAFSIERYVAVHYPLARQRICTPEKAKRIIGILMFVALIAFSYVLVIAQVVQVDGYVEMEDYLERNVSTVGGDPRYIIVRCSVPLEYHRVSEIANYLDTAITFVVPLGLITFFNLRIALCLWKDRSCLNGQSKVDVRVTKTLLLISGMFLVLNLPAHLLRCAQFIQSIAGLEDFKNDFLHMALPWTNILFNTNFAINFLLYCVSGRNFRMSLISLLLQPFSRELERSSPRTQSTGGMTGPRTRKSSSLTTTLALHHAITDKSNGAFGEREDEDLV